MNLPEWVEKLARESSVSQAAFTPKLIQALGIALDALAYYREKADDSVIADDAINEIEDMDE